MELQVIVGTKKWQQMVTQQREEAVECACSNGTQNVEHVLANCEYMWDCIDGMIATVNGALQSEPDEAAAVVDGAQRGRQGSGSGEYGGKESLTGCVARDRACCEDHGREGRGHPDHCQRDM